MFIHFFETTINNILIILLLSGLLHLEKQKKKTNERELPRLTDFADLCYDPASHIALIVHSDLNLC